MSSSNIVNSVAFVRTTREFPDEVYALGREMNRGWIELANAINNRTISIFPITRSAQTGESWFLVKNQRQQTLRQVYTFTSTASINHGISVTNPNQFTRCFGSYTNGTDSFGLIFGTNGGTIPNQISFYLTSTQIIFEVDGGAPALSSGLIVLEWLSQV
jgi:hypothetical protein